MRGVRRGRVGRVGMIWGRPRKGGLLGPGGHEGEREMSRRTEEQMSTEV